MGLVSFIVLRETEAVPIHTKRSSDPEQGRVPSLRSPQSPWPAAADDAVASDGCWSGQRRAFRSSLPLLIPQQVREHLASQKLQVEIAKYEHEARCKFLILGINDC